jgi:hypothetical protein
MENKEWIEPELIVLVRSKPEEAVLDTCKGDKGFVGPDYYVDTCVRKDIGGYCTDYVAS